MNWFDSHCHLESIEDDAASVIARAAEADVVGMVTVATDLETSLRSIEIASAHEGVWATVGVHPDYCVTLDEETAAKIEALASNPKVVAVGEIGLDFYRGDETRDAQRDALALQLRIARRTDKAVVLHIRSAFDEVMEVLAAESHDRLVFHCFGGGKDEAMRALDVGGYISFAGNVSFKTAEDLRDAARVTPMDRLLIETDSPYLAPVPKRGRPNEPAYVPHVGAAIAEAKGLTADEVAAVTYENARRAFGL